MCTREEFAGKAQLDITLQPPAFRHWLGGACNCGAEHGWADDTPRKNWTREGEARLPLHERHEIFSAALALLDIRQGARLDLLRRGLHSEDIDRGGYRSLPHRGREVKTFMDEVRGIFGERRLRECPGFLDKNGLLNFRTNDRDHECYIVPYRNSSGLITGIQFKTVGGKYETARGSRTGDMLHAAGTFVQGADLYLTEGAIKAEVAHKLGGLNVIGMPGQSLSDDHVAMVHALMPGRVIVALDEERNSITALARERWLEKLHRSGLPTFRATWDGADAGGPKGLDDLLAASDLPRIRSVYFAPSEIGQRTQVRPTEERGAVETGLSLTVAREATQEAILSFFHAAGGRRR